MKELTIEEKAQRYNEVVERAKTEKEKSRNLGLLEFIDENFPELKESEEEKIKKMIINTLNRDKILTEDEAYDCIAWLEKQGEQKPCSWKPSKEQMKALHDLNLTGNISYAGQGQALIELYNELRKLTENKVMEAPKKILKEVEDEEYRRIQW